ncbi:MAG: hypothetical protein P4L44_16240 [Oryzomonas sp.]|uniref:hypothetical protein n=1 Tax=Oryzomonas sp. TaxID=2855186 RepID=UPI00284BDFB1|nr:hypothetical protein [Oryzomonas sp.]MDR3581512.1 hypothetical protein [Oryzomonas sp.]
MKRIVPAIVMVFSLVAVSHAINNHNSEKDWCLFGISNKCPNPPTFDLSEKIRRLETAIKKGTAVYTPEELERLSAMLADAYTTKELLERY